MRETILVKDESLFSLNTNSRYNFTCLQKIRIHYLPSSLQEKDHNGKENLMVRWNIMLDGRKSLHVFGKCSMTGVKHRNDILSYIRLLRDAICPDFITIRYNMRLDQRISGKWGYSIEGFVRQISRPKLNTMAGTLHGEKLVLAFYLSEPSRS